MSDENIKSHLEKSKNDLVSTGIDVGAEWGKRVIREKGPEFLDWLVKSGKEIISLFGGSKSPEWLTKAIQKAVDIGYEEGHRVTLLAMCKAMEINGFSNEQILKVLDKAGHIQNDCVKTEQN